MQKRNYISEVLKKFLSGRFPSPVEKGIQQWLLHENFREEKDYSLQEWWNGPEVFPDAEAEKCLAELKQKLNVDKKAKELSIIRKKLLLRIAAILLPVLLLSGFYFYYSAFVKNTDLTEVVEVSYGDQDYLVLADGTEVWINAGSVLHYSSQPGLERQKVDLKGEAYFNVKKTSSGPFTVQTENFMIEATGTSFNVWDYPEEERGVTTLDEGSLRVTVRDGSRYELNPHEQLIYEEVSSEVKIAPVENTSLFSSWRKEYIVLEGLTLEEVLRTFERNLDVTIHIKGELETQGRYVGKLHRNEEISVLLDIMNYLTEFSYEVKAKEVFIYPGNGPV